MTRRITTAAICLALSALAVYAAKPKDMAERINSSDVAVRRQVAIELRGVKKINKKLTPVLLQASRDTDADVRMHAYFAIYKADPRLDGVVPAIIAGMKDTVVDVRRAAVSSLSGMNPFPSRCLPQMGNLLFDPDPVISQQTYATFVELAVDGGLGVGTIIKLIVDGTNEQRVVLANLLEAIGPPAKSALPQLKNLLKSKDPKVVAAAERAIKRVDR